MKTSEIYSLSIEQIVNAAVVGGMDSTIIIKGEMGGGKSTISRLIKQEPEYAKHVLVRMDCTTLDLGDIMVPDIMRLGQQDSGTHDISVMTYAFNERLGLHESGPIILDLDEFGKSNRSVQNALLPLLLDHELAGRMLHPKSVVIASTNLGAEGVGDLLQPHARNRVTLVDMRKSDNMEWLENFAVNAGIDPSMMAWVKDTPELFQSFRELDDPEENQMIYHPLALNRDSFVTGRSLEKASNWLKKRHLIDSTTLTAVLIGTIGPMAAKKLAAYVALGDQLPKLADIKVDPNNVIIPKDASAVCMVVYSALSTIEKEWVDAWMVYLNRLSKTAQELFCNGVRADKYSRRDIVVNTQAFQSWCLENNYLFTADKK